ncbi:putative nitroreductase [Fulvivirga imtechensis AK7]|uniref:Putative NAD(P)H nitroreductase n=1 Tax=Fulvivirga imtechensis AK7 TaxID=1237149 RepID=L8JYZ8_9BACT|nr:nitroreductase [Fulvivirga imtechensis]ELR72864.1 putative nitroreductase [Fulvivirga imtechensis AK7]
MEFTKAVNEMIRTRRSIYTNMFSGEVVDDNIIDEMLENANWAPTHKLTEPWRFVVFTGKGLKKLSEFQGELYKARNQDHFKEDVYNKFKSKPLECSHVIAIGMHRDEEHSLPEVEEVCATACAVQNMWLTASAHRIGCYWSTGGVTFYEEAKPFFGLGEEDLLLGFLYIGVPKTGAWPQGRRKPAEDKVKWVKG